MLGLVLNDHREYRDSYRSYGHAQYRRPPSVEDRDDSKRLLRIPVPGGASGDSWG